ncbi:MAG: Eco57I restriction-modification methylase domain-containing protein, partial [Proteobacteria bacterium]|nr:Eco57I restriction-modification methylase domain-containing protein [Pseudomonadota bacterium]
MHKIAAGEICHANDLITYNLDMRQFAYDLIDQTKNPQFVMDFLYQLEKITILDPTCGSGAFLFAALNILEPLYEICIERMKEFAEGHGGSGEYRFDAQLARINKKFRSNIQYYIYKTIILNNLYGVDIMPEAVEIAKLRLFLKLVAVVDVDVNADNLGLDPLPDIDFNIRCGNTLVGYATEAELHDALHKQHHIDQAIAANELSKEIKSKLEAVAEADADFKTAQRDYAEEMDKIKKSKDKLTNRLTALNDILDDHYHKATQPQIDFGAWKASHQPFHWLAEFYTIMRSNGGFDVIIGNPPYVEYKKKDSKTKRAIFDIYKLHGYKTIDCGNLYAYVIERDENLLKDGCKTGMIIPHSAICTDRMEKLYKIFLKKKGWFSTYDIRPARLFDGVDQRLLVYILNGNNIYTSK